MKYRILFSFLLVLGTVTYAQQNKLDSVENLLKKHIKNDTLRITLFNKLSYNYATVDPQKGLNYANEAILLAKKINDIKKISYSYIYKGDNYAKLGKDSIATFWYNEGLKEAKAINDKLAEGIALDFLAYQYINNSQYKKALELRLIALELFTAVKDNVRIGGTLGNIGTSYFYLSDYPASLKYYLKSLNLAEISKNKSLQINQLMNVGLVYKKMRNYSKALFYYEKSSKIALSMGNEQLYGDVLGKIGVIYDVKGDHKKAINLWLKAIVICKKIKDKRREADHLANIGVAYSYLEQYSSSIYYFKLALKIHEDFPNLNNSVAIYGELAYILVNASDTALANAKIAKSTRFQEAEKYAKYAIKLSKEIESLDREMESWNTLAEVHEKQQNFKLALQDLKYAVKLKDSIFNDEKKAEITELGIQYEADKKQLIADEEIKYQKTVKNYSIIGIVILLLAAAGIFIFYKNHRDSIQKQNELSYKAKVADTDMRILRLQMNPHFIFNSLNSISDYISKNDIQNADYYLSKFAKLMRGILENSEEKEIPLSDELKMLELYMQLEGSRLNNKFTYVIKVSDNVDAEITMVPPLILQPFVENSIWHGLADKDAGGKITIEVTRDNTLLNCIVEDNGVGRKSAKPSSGKSYGMKITKDRIELLNKLKNTNASVNLVDLEKGTRVEVKLPFETEA